MSAGLAQQQRHEPLHNPRLKGREIGLLGLGRHVGPHRRNVGLEAGFQFPNIGLEAGFHLPHVGF